MHRTGLICLIVFCALTEVFAMPEHSLTIYSKSSPGAVQPEQFEQQASDPSQRINIPGYAVVRTLDKMKLDRPAGEVSFTNVAAGIDPTTVTFKSLTDTEDTHVLEQNYRYDLVSNARMLERFIDQTITVRKSLGDRLEEVTGTLMAAQADGLILQLEDGRLMSMSGVSDVVFPDLPDGLITRPTLIWLVATDHRGQHDIQVSYETRGMTWWADYNLTLDESDGCRVDVGAWVSIVNQSGGSFEQAAIKLIAGDVNRAPEPAQPVRRRLTMETYAMADSGFEEESFFEYHLYTLGRRADLPDRSLKQLELFPTAYGASCNRQMVFDTGYRPGGVFSEPYTSNQHPTPLKGKVRVSLVLENRESNRLGMALPAGRIRVSQKNPNDGNLEFIGEDVIDHTPRNETVSVQLGNAFDVVGERIQSGFRWDQRERWMEETIEVTLRNQKEQSVEVLVRESLLRWSNWTLKRQSHDSRQLDAASIEFRVSIQPEAEAVVSYTVRYDW